MKPLITILATFIATGSALALEPANVFLLANKNLPASQDAVDMTFGHAFEQPREVIVDALRGAFFAHFMPGCGIFT